MDPKFRFTPGYSGKWFAPQFGPSSLCVPLPRLFPHFCPVVPCWKSDPHRRPSNGFSLWGMEVPALQVFSFPSETYSLTHVQSNPDSDTWQAEISRKGILEWAGHEMEGMGNIVKERGQYVRSHGKWASKGGWSLFMQGLCGRQLLFLPACLLPFFLVAIHQYFFGENCMPSGGPVSPGHTLTRRELIHIIIISVI